MKPVFLEFTDEEGKVTKTFTTCTLKTGMVDNIFGLAERADNMKKEETTISDVKEFYRDLKALILSVFKYQFTLEELNEGVEQEAIQKAFQDICKNISGEMKKN